MLITYRAHNGLDVTTLRQQIKSSRNSIQDYPPNQDVYLPRHIRIPSSFSVHGRKNLIINPSSSIFHRKHTIFSDIPQPKITLIIKDNILKALQQNRELIKFFTMMDIMTLLPNPLTIYMSIRHQTVFINL